jgi:hypothetical protein
VHLSDKVYYSGFDHLNGIDGGKVVPGTTRPYQDIYNPKYCLFETDTHLIVVIRGTQEQEEWIGNFLFMEVYDSALGAHFHCNFYQCAVNIMNVIRPTLMRTQKKILVTGHSRGGGIATILHTMIFREISSRCDPEKFLETIVFGSPPSMSHAGYVAKSSHLISYVVNENDLVTRASAKFLLSRILPFLTPDFCNNPAVKSNPMLNALCHSEIASMKNLTADPLDTFHIYLYDAGDIYWLRDLPSAQTPKHRLEKYKLNSTDFKEAVEATLIDPIADSLAHYPHLYSSFIDSLPHQL